MNAKGNKSLSIKFTDDEWLEMQGIIRMANKKDLSGLIQKEALRLKSIHCKAYTDITRMSSKTVHKRPSVTGNVYSAIQQIALVLNMQPREVVINLIVRPLLTNSLPQKAAD